MTGSNVVCVRACVRACVCSEGCREREEHATTTRRTRGQVRVAATCAHCFGGEPQRGLPCCGERCYPAAASAARTRRCAGGRSSGAAGAESRAGLVYGQGIAPFADVSALSVRMTRRWSRHDCMASDAWCIGSAQHSRTRVPVLGRARRGRELARWQRQECEPRHRLSQADQMGGLNRRSHPERHAARTHRTWACACAEVQRNHRRPNSCVMPWAESVLMSHRYTLNQMNRQPVRATWSHAAVLARLARAARMRARRQPWESTTPNTPGRRLFRVRMGCSENRKGGGRVSVFGVCVCAVCGPVPLAAEVSCGWHAHAVVLRYRECAVVHFAAQSACGMARARCVRSRSRESNDVRRAMTDDHVARTNIIVRVILISVVVIVCMFISTVIGLVLHTVT
jgi:hypothetical protein